MQAEATNKNVTRSDEDAKNFKYLVVGRRGERRIIRVPVQEGRPEAQDAPGLQGPTQARSPQSPGGSSPKRMR